MSFVVRETHEYKGYGYEKNTNNLLKNVLH